MCGACIDLILYSTSCFKVNAQDIHFEKIPVSISIKLPSIQKKYGQLSKVGPVHYIRPAAANIMQYAQHIHVVTPVHSLYYITSYTKKYGSGQPNTDIKLPHLLQETGAISKSRASPQCK